MKTSTKTFIVILCASVLGLAKCLKYNLMPFSELSLVSQEGKQLWESFSDNVKLPEYGSCWKNAVSNLRLGCKFLSEDVQIELALRFTDCFLQMSGYGPMTCVNSKDVCLRNLPDRAFNAYTEFYTHTQSICYFLQSQVWHEETQKTIDRLSDTSEFVSMQLEEAGQIQQTILDKQKESMIIQNVLLDNGKTIASALDMSEKKILKIMKDFEDSAVEQKKVLFELFGKLDLLQSWVVGEMTWINSILFYMASLIIGYLFTSISSTKQARIYILLCLSINYLIERFIYTQGSDESLNEEYLNSWIWFTRRVFIVLSAIVLIHSFFTYCDYNIVNHNLLVEIRHQNRRILSIFEKNSNLTPSYLYKQNINTGIDISPIQEVPPEIFNNVHTVRRSTISKTLTAAPPLLSMNKEEKWNVLNQKNLSLPDEFNIDDIDFVCEKLETNTLGIKRETPYNLRSNKKKSEMS